MSDAVKSAVNVQVTATIGENVSAPAQCDLPGAWPTVRGST